MTRALTMHSTSHIKMALITLCGVAALFSFTVPAHAQSMSASGSQSGGGGGAMSGSGYSSPSSNATDSSKVKGMKKRLNDAKKRLATLEAKEDKTEANLAAIERLKTTTIPDLEEKLDEQSSRSTPGGSQSSGPGVGGLFGSPSGMSGSGSGSYGAALGIGMGGGASLDALQKRIAQLEEMQKRLKNLMNGTKASSTPREGSGPNRPACPPATSASTSNASARCIQSEAKASSTLSVLHPNSGVVVRNKKDAAIMVMWKHRGVTTVDIDLKKTGSSTVSVVKDIPASNLMGAAIGGFTDATDPTKSLKGKKGVGRYLYKGAPSGKGYAIVITGKKVGGGTIVDESNKTFTIADAKSVSEWTASVAKEAKKAANDADETEEEESEDGDVLGASTSVTDEYLAVLDGLEEILVGFSDELSK